MYKLLISILILFTFSSCLQNKNLYYLQDIDNQIEDSINQANINNYRIQAHDILSIQIHGLDKKNISIFNIYSENISSYNNEAGLYLNGYIVNETGEIELPVIGKVEVINLTINEIQNKLNNLIGEFLKGAIVSVKLISFKISIMGEVSRPGVYNIYKNQVNILEAISMAGDVTTYADIKKVLVIRSINGKTISNRIDLTDVKFIQSNAYYLFPNDIIYIQPLKLKTIRENISVYSLFLSTITTFILVFSFIK
ncbi:MAG: polysaccharide export protein [Bacteroidales bacterium]|nr:polysaccharide export protein [Bacteroidales bacterium]